MSDDAALALKIGTAAQRLNELIGLAAEEGLTVATSFTELSLITRDKICRYTGVSVSVSRNIPINTTQGERSHD